MVIMDWYSRNGEAILRCSYNNSCNILNYVWFLSQCLFAKLYDYTKWLLIAYTIPCSNVANTMAVETILIGYNILMITNLNDESLEWVDQNSLQTGLIVVYADWLQLRTGWDMRSRHLSWLQNKIRSDQAETNWLTSRTI